MKKLDKDQKIALEVLRLSPESIIVISNDNKIVSFNIVAEKTFLYSSEEVCGEDLSVLLPEFYRKAHNQEIENFRKSETVTKTMNKRGKIYGRRKDGEVFPAEASISVVNVDGVQYCVAVLRDITKRLAKEKELKKAIDDFKLLVKSAGEGIFSIDLDGNCLFVNPYALDVLGYQSESELVGVDIYTTIHYHDNNQNEISKDDCTILKTLKTGLGQHVTEELFRCSDGSAIDVEYRVSPISEDGQVVGAVITFSDITERLQLYKRLEYIAQHDHLTNLPNRMLFTDRLTSAAARAKRFGSEFAILYMDLNGFKEINDQFDHATGDKMLVAVASAMSKSIRETDTIARIGGDEFAVIAEQVDGVKGLRQIAEKLYDAVGSCSVMVDSQPCNISTSIGIAIYPEDAPTTDLLLKKADAAMYAAKHGSESIVFAFK